MNIKKLLCLGLLLFTVVALFACGPDEPPVDTYYTVTYDSDGGTDVTAQSIKENEKAIPPIPPAKEGYDFAGWYLGEVAFSFDTAITQDIALKAKWTKTSYTVTFMDGANVLDLNPKTYDIETDTFDLPVPTKQHYNFMGWYKDTDFTQSAQSVELGTTGNLVFYAQFTLKNYGITYHLYDGENSNGNPSTYNLETTLPITLASPKKDGFNFLGWYGDANYTGEAITAITEIAGDVTLYAKWEEITDVPEECVHVDANDDLLCDKCEEPYDDGPNQTVEPETEYDITYKDGEATLTLEPAIYKVGEVTTLPLAEKAHHHFLGWYTTATFDEGTKIEEISAAQTGDLVLYAKFEAVVYTITYHLAGGTNSEDNPDTYTVNDSDLIFANPTKEGHSFAGWYTDALYKNGVSSLNGKSGNLVLYAKWVQTGGSGILTPEDKFD